MVFHSTPWKKKTKWMLLDTATTVETPTRATEGATLPNTEGEEAVTNHPEVGMSHQEEDTLEQAGEATTKVKPHPQHNLKEGATLAKEETTKPMVNRTLANGVRIAKNRLTIRHSAGPRKR